MPCLPLSRSTFLWLIFSEYALFSTVRIFRYPYLFFDFSHIALISSLMRRLSGFSGFSERFRAYS